MTEPGPPRDRTQDTRRMKAILVAMAALAFAVAPLAVPFDGFDPDLFPVPQQNPPVQPAGYAFAIWGPIYVWLLASAVFGLFARAEAAEWDAPRWPLVGSLVIGAAWLPVAQVSPVWALVLIWAMLVLALWALVRTPSSDRWLLRAPIALYAGWLTAAAWVAIGLTGAGYGIRLGQTGWAFAALIGALVTAGLVQWRVRRIPMYTLAAVWALVGVAVANFGDLWSLVALSLAGAAALTAQAVRDHLS